jgi:hypothetical protein
MTLQDDTSKSVDMIRGYTIDVHSVDSMDVDVVDGVDVSATWILWTVWMV